MAELEKLTVKKLDIAIASFNDQKKRKENISNSTQKKLDGLIKKYTDTKKLILTTYQKNKTHANLIGIDKSTLSLNELATLLGKSVDDIKGTGGKKAVGWTVGLLSAASVLTIAGEQIGQYVSTEAGKQAMATALQNIGKWFAETLWPAIAANPLTTIGIGLGVAAIAVGATYLIKKKLQNEKDKKLLMEQEAEEKMNEGVQSRNISNFKTSANLNTLAEEIANDPDLQTFIENAIRSTSPAITPLMRLHMTKALNLAEHMNKNAEKDAEKIDLERRLTKNAPESAIEDYAQAVEDEKTLTDLRAKAAIASKGKTFNTAALTGPIKAHLDTPAAVASVKATLDAYLLIPGKTVDTFMTEKCSSGTDMAALIGYTATIAPAAVAKVRTAIKTLADEHVAAQQAETEGKKLAAKLGIAEADWNDPTKHSAADASISTKKTTALNSITSSVPVVHDPSLDSLAEADLDTLLTAEGITAPSGATKDIKMGLYERALLDKKLVSDNILDNAIATRQAARTATKS